MHDDLLALDPGINRAGIALYRNGSLIAATAITSKLRGDILARVLHISEQAALWVLINQSRPVTLVAEWPPVYKPAQEKKGGPRAVVPLAGVCGALAGILKATAALRPIGRDLECVSYEPSKWLEGQVPKDETVAGCKSSPRAVKIVSRLNHAERVTWDTIKYHDEIDAVGIGLHHLGRLGRRRVFPGAT